MENKAPTTKFLKVMAILLIIIQALGVVIAAALLIKPDLLPNLMPNLPKTLPNGMPREAMLALVIVLAVVMIVMGIVALMRKKLILASYVVLALALFSVLYSISAYELKTLKEILPRFCSLIIPLLFYFAAYRQNKLDKNAGES